MKNLRYSDMWRLPFGFDFNKKFLASATLGLLPLTARVASLPTLLGL